MESWNAHGPGYLCLAIVIIILFAEALQRGLDSDYKWLVENTHDKRKSLLAQYQQSHVAYMPFSFHLEGVIYHRKC